MLPKQRDLENLTYETSDTSDLGIVLKDIAITGSGITVGGKRIIPKEIYVMRLTPKYEYKQRVKIISLDVEGRITEVCINSDIYYKVEYWWNGEIKVVNLFEDEILSLKERTE